MKYILYANGGSGNHGCEAIVRGTQEILGGNMTIHSKVPEEDLKYGLGEFAQVVPAVSAVKKDLTYIKSYAKLKLFGNYTDMDGLAYLPTIEQENGKGRLALSVGGDNYCYSDQPFYAFLNRAYRKNGYKTVLWGCSIEPDVVKNEKISDDLKRYSLIVAREGITYDALKKIGANVVLAPDPAFYMNPEECDLDSRIADGNTVGINISPMILSNESRSGLAYNNYKALIRHILDNTDMNVALIPHVVWESNDDRTVLKRLYDDFGKDDRLVPVDDHKAPELKYVISRCRLFVGARTHSTIAAYSSCVPTLVVGYSVKARGIARDLFGSEENYVLPVQALKEENELTQAFLWLCKNEEEIRSGLNRTMPEYKNTMTSVRKTMEEYYEE